VEIEFNCFYKCGERFTQSTFREHEKLCPRARVLVTDVAPRGFHVPVINGKDELIPMHNVVERQYVDHFREVGKNLQDAVRRWNPQRVRDAIRACAPEGHPEYEHKDCECPGCQLDVHLLERCEARAHRLACKKATVRKLIAKGNLDIDFDECEIMIKKAIAFENRAPPDSSAVLLAANIHESTAVIRHLAVVICAYEAQMTVAGHTGRSDPYSFWSALATNRAKLVCEMCESFGVPKGQLRPVGVADGLGAKVKVLPIPYDINQVD